MWCSFATAAPVRLAFVGLTTTLQNLITKLITAAASSSLYGYIRTKLSSTLIKTAYCTSVSKSANPSWTLSFLFKTPYQTTLVLVPCVYNRVKHCDNYLAWICFNFKRGLLALPSAICCTSLDLEVCQWNTKPGRWAVCPRDTIEKQKSVGLQAKQLSHEVAPHVACSSVTACNQAVVIWAGLPPNAEIGRHLLDYFGFGAHN